MTPISAIKGLFTTLTGGGAVSSDAPTGQICVVDGASLIGGRDASRASPRAQIEVLKSLSRFCEREDVPVHVFFQSAPLNVVGDQEDFRGITAYFLDPDKPVADGVQSILSKAGKKSVVVLVTRAPDLEETFGKAGYTLLRPSTFRKGLDGLAQSDRPERGERGERGGRGRRDRGRGRGRSGEARKDGESRSERAPSEDGGPDGGPSRSRRRRRRGRRSGQDGGGAEGGASKSGASSSGDDVSHLIDVVD